MAALNANGVSDDKNADPEFLQKQEIDNILLQEVTTTNFDLIRGYIAYTNEWINKHCTAMLTREKINVTSPTVATGAENGILLPRWLYSKYICTVCLI